MVQHPIYTDAEARSRETFLAMLHALSTPGWPYTLPVSADASIRQALHLLAEALLDLETSFFTPDASLHQQLSASGARALEPERAAYHFYTRIDSDALALVESAAVGTVRDPDQSATLMLPVTLAVGEPWHLSGPGIQGTRVMRIGGLPTAFWELRRAACQYPLGWDLLLVDGDQLIGLPRTTILTAAEES